MISPLEPARDVFVMYASNLQQLLFHCCSHSDLSPEAFSEYTERFNSLRSYRHLPPGRAHRGQLLSPNQIALAILGLVPQRPGWAGHGATILRTLAPVGGPAASFLNASSLVDAIKLLLSDDAARKDFVALRIMLGEVGVNSAGAAILSYGRQGQRNEAVFVPHLATSLTREGTELLFDLEGFIFSPACREMSFRRPFFDRIAGEMRVAADNRSEPLGDGSEYDEEETRQALWEKMAVTSQSRFLNLAADNHVTWPREITLIRFSGYHFVLMPRTRENVQSVHMDLTANRLDDVGAATIIRRFLSIMAWCDDNFATLGFGWSGNPVPIAVAKPELAFKTTTHYIFDRKIPTSEEGRRALALYREALNAEHAGLISYAVLNYYKIIELTKHTKEGTKRWFRENFAYVRSIDHLKRSLEEFEMMRGNAEPHEYIHNSCRLAVAHAGKISKSDPDDATESRRLHTAADIMQALARRFIEIEFGVSDCMFDGT